MFILHVEMTFQEGHAQKFCDEIMKIRDRVLTEDGCSKYEPYLVPNSNKAVMMEMWRDDEALDTHMNQPHLKALFELTNPWQTCKPTMTKYQIA